MPRRYPLVQFPNAPALLAVLGHVISRRASGGAKSLAAAGSGVALLVWAEEEITEGANGFRRLLGVLGGLLAVTRLIGLAERLPKRAS